MPLQLKIKGGIIQDALYFLKDDTFYRAEFQKDIKQSIPRPSGEAFEHKRPDITDFLLASPQPVFGIEKIDYTDDGIFVHLVGHNGEKLKYPTKGFPFPEAAQANNIFKRLLVGQVRYLAKNPLALLPLLSRRGLAHWLNIISSAAEITLGPYYLQDKYYNRATKEIRKLVYNFMRAIVQEDTAQSFAKTIATVFEYDNAYLLRIQDLMNETTKEAILKNPRKEFERLFGILKERDERLSMRTKFSSGIKLLSLALWIPKFRRGFYNAIKEMTLENIQMDDGDRYQVLRWINYNFLGKTFEERVKEFQEIHKGNIPTALVLQS